MASSVGGTLPPALYILTGDGDKSQHSRFHCSPCLMPCSSTGASDGTSPRLQGRRWAWPEGHPSPALVSSQLSVTWPRVPAGGQPVSRRPLFISEAIWEVCVPAHGCER